jgi:hypothetical protein
MRRISVVVFAVLCVCMAATTSASANLFHASKTGKILGLATSTQIFKTGAGAAVECEHAAITGTVTELLGLHQLVEVIYSKCLAGGVATAHITPALYLFSADGLVAVENTIIITVLKTILTAQCTIKVGPQDLGTIKYEADPGNSSALLELTFVKGIKSVSSGEPCGPAGESVTGTDEGGSLLRLDGGSLGWL